MLAALGFITVIAMLILIMTKKASPAVALIIVPLITGIIACAFIVTDPEGAPGVVNFAANVKSLGGMIAGDDGLLSVAATGVMFIFSILFFGILTDAGTFRPIIGGITKLVGTNPILIAIGTSILAMIVHLDGSGAVTFLICVPPLVPLYDAVGMKRTTLATIVAMSAGTMNILPWGGPTIRAATALNVDVVSELFMPVLPAVLVGLALDEGGIPQTAQERVDALTAQAQQDWEDYREVFFATGGSCGSLASANMKWQISGWEITVIPVADNPRQGRYPSRSPRTRLKTRAWRCRKSRDQVTASPCFPQQ